MLLYLENYKMLHFFSGTYCLISVRLGEDQYSVISPWRWTH